MATSLTINSVDGIATITIDDPDAQVNTVSSPWIEDMIAAFEAIAADDAVKGVVITSTKPGFMAGADLKHMLDEVAGMKPADAFALSQRATRMHRLIETCGKPVVAAMTGFALGGGYELALACTFRIVADDPKAVVGCPEVKVGLLPGSGGTQRLPRMIGVSRAADVLLEGRSYAPQEAFELGLVDQVEPRANVIEAARRWLAHSPDPVRPWDTKSFRIPESNGLLSQATAAFFSTATAKLLAKHGQNYPAPISILACLFEGVQVPFDKSLLIESRHFAKLLTGPVARNIIRTGFVNKGRAERGAGRPQGVAKSHVDRIGIVGAGMMGGGIAFVCAKAGIEVVLLDTSPEAAATGKAYSERLLAKDMERDKIGRDTADRLLSYIAPTADYADLAGVDLLIEAVFENVAVKAEVTAKAEAAIGGKALYASNTSTLPITRLAEAFGRPEDFIGLHFFSPVDRMPLVEVIMGRRTSQASLARALDFVGQIRKTPIIVNDGRGFFTSRVFQTFIHEGMELLCEGVAPALIENAARHAGMPLGPLAVTDEVTLDLPISIIRQTECEEPDFLRPNAMDVLETMAEGLGRRGRKSGGGFYEYAAGGGKSLWRGLVENFPLVPVQPGAEEVKKRLLYIQALETARCLEEGVLTGVADGDLGSLLGWGYPAWTGGALSLIDMIGLPEFIDECDRMAQTVGPRFAPTAGLRAMAETGGSFHT